MSPLTPGPRACGQRDDWDGRKQSHQCITREDVTVLDIFATI